MMIEKWQAVLHQTAIGETYLKSLHRTDVAGMAKIAKRAVLIRTG